MRKYLTEKREDGVVLVTSLLFLFVITILAVTSLQSPRTDIMISGNEKYLDNSQQMANMGVMEAKTWLSVRHRPKSVPLNYLFGSDLVVVAVRGQEDTVETQLKSNFSRFGTSKKVSNSITTDNNETIEPFAASPTDGFQSVKINSKKIGKYKWSIVRITDLHISGGASESDFNTYRSKIANGSVGGKAASRSLIDKFKTKKQLSKGWDAALDRDRAVLQYFYIFSEGRSGPSESVVSNSESIVGYRQIIPDNS